MPLNSNILSCKTPSEMDNKLTKDVPLKKVFFILIIYVNYFLRSNNTC